MSKNSALSPKTHVPLLTRVKLILLHPLTWFFLLAPPGLLGGGIGLINLHIHSGTSGLIFHQPHDVKPAYTGILLGARVYGNGGLSEMLQDRADTTVRLYSQGKIKRILVTGDHGRTNYDEVNTIRKYLLNHGIPAQDIFLDHAGFDTYDSMYRAKEIFEVNEAIVITQEFHLPRALYLAKSRGIKVQGMVADSHVYPGLKNNQAREVLANVKAWLDLRLGTQPTYLGEKIPITGESHNSWDQF